MQPRPASFSVFLLPLLLASCFQDQEKLAFLASEVESLDAQLKASQELLSSIEEQTYEISGQISDLQVKRRNVRFHQEEEVDAIKELSDVTTYEKELRESLRQLDIVLASWKEATRHSLKGFVISSFTPSGSSILVNPVVKEVSDAGVAFSHPGGDVTVPFANLPESLREAFVDESLPAFRTTH
jgi:hypothetical protein